jgi:hypothetical protein
MHAYSCKTMTIIKVKKIPASPRFPYIFAFSHSVHQWESTTDKLSISLGLIAFSFNFVSVDCVLFFCLAYITQPDFIWGFICAFVRSFLLPSSISICEYNTIYLHICKHLGFFSTNKAVTKFVYHLWRNICFHFSWVKA